MTKYEKDRCELCEGPLNEDNTHVMEMPDATWLIHKGCALRLFKGVWDEQVLRSTIPIGDNERMQKSGELLISRPELAPMGFQFFSEESELTYTPPDLYASDLIMGKSLVRKGGEVSPTTSYTDEKYMEDYNRLHEEWEVAVTNLAETHGHKNPIHKLGDE